MEQMISALTSANFLQTPVWMWGVFLAIVLILLILDLGLFNRKDHEIGVRESLRMSVFYISVGLLFGGWIWWMQGEDKAVEYVTGFVIEKTLAMDNIFVIAMIFSYFRIPRMYQHRVLFWGILGVILLRGIMIGFGSALVHQFEWILYLFAAFLVFTGIKMLFATEEPMDISENFALRFMQRHLRITNQLQGRKFYVRLPHKHSSKPVVHFTPLFVALVMVEIADVIFAVDSVPAIFAITTDTYIVYTSNIFAILGLRALYFALAAMINRFEYLKYALSVVLIFIGTKIFVSEMFTWIEISPEVSLLITVGILAAGVAFSLWKTARHSKSES